MSEGSWVRAIAYSATALTLAPLTAYMYAHLAIRVITTSSPWEKGRIYPILPLKVRVDEGFIRRRVRRAVAVSRANGTPLTVSQQNISHHFRRARVTYDGIKSLTSSLPLLAQLLLVGFTGYHLYKSGDHKGFTPENLYNLSLIFGALLSWLAFSYRILRAREEWRRKTADQEALRSCIYVLHLCGEVVRGKAKILEVEEAVMTLCGELGDFSSNSPALSDPRRKENVAAHISLVQQELIESSGVLLSEGFSGLARLIERVGTLLGRLIEQRWLCLLDLPAGVSTEGVTLSPEEQVDRRDAWIVIAGSMLAAIGLGASVSMGVPLVAAVPAALVFLLGPATLWGSKRLGVSPRDFLASVRMPINEANAGASQQQATPSSQSSTAP
ncbi:hypothetical protein ACF1GY_02705 [Streptomyces sp. NPDC014684]|uniref:hypothetical protein n=1 Tax=Streptomyces sp. NPDC014684 TaxID=3364880 RepID=UPI0037001349